MSDTENNDSPTDGESATDAAPSVPDANAEEDGASAPSAARNTQGSSGLTLPSPDQSPSPTTTDDDASTPSTTQRPSLSERLRKLAKKQNTSANEKTSDNVGFVSSLTDTPPPNQSPDGRAESDAGYSSADTADAPTNQTPGDDAENTAREDDPEVAKTDRVTSLPFDVVGAADFETNNGQTPPRDDNESPAGSGGFDTVDSGGFDTVDAAPTDSGDFDTDAVFDTEEGADITPAAATERMEAPASIPEPRLDDSADIDNSTDRIASPAFDDVDDATDRMAAPIDGGLDDAASAPDTDSAPAPYEHSPATDDTAPPPQDEGMRAATDPGAPIFDTNTDTLDPAGGVEAFSDDIATDSDDLARPEVTSSPAVSPSASEGRSHRVSPSSTTSTPGADPTTPDVDADADTSSSDTPSEFDAEDTEIFASAFDNDPISPRLSTLEGPAVGQDFLVNRMRNSIGRGTANSISVPDPAMSRMHFEIVQNPDDSYLLKDLRAVNGTSLNGIPIQEADLFHGDRVEAGQSTFQFVIPGDAPVDDRQRHLVPAASTDTVAATDADELRDSDQVSVVSPSRGAHRLLMIITIAAAVLSIPLLGVLLHATILDTDDADEAIASESALDPYFEGVEAFRNRDLDGAEELFRESLRIDPDFERADAQLERIEDERTAGAIIDEAAARADEEFDDDLLDDLRAIPRDSHYYQDAQDKLSRVPHNEARLLFVDAQRAFDDGDFDASAELVTQVRAIEPQHEGARRLEEAIDEQRDADDVEESNDAEESDDATGGVAAPSAPTPPPRQRDDDDETTSPLLDSSFASDDDADRSASSARPGDINFMDGFNLYREDRLSEAIDHFDAIVESSTGRIAERAERTADNIRTFKQSRQAGEQALHSGDYGAAVDHFEKALRADESVVAGGSFHARISDHLSEALARAGLEKLDHGDHAGAFNSLQQAENYDADHSRVATLRSEVDDTARSLYERATSKKHQDPEEASRLFEVVTTMVSPSSELHQSARQHLEGLP